MEPAKAPLPALLFNRDRNPGVYAQLGVSDRIGLTAEALRPTVTFHQAIAAAAGRYLPGADGRLQTLPYTLPDGPDDAVLKLRLRRYAPGVVAVTAELRASPTSLDPLELIDRQRLDAHPAVDVVLRAIARIVGDGTHRIAGLAPRPHVRPIIELRLDEPSIESLYTSDSPELAAVVIRNRNWHHADDSLATSIWNKNRALNVKTRHQIVLADKQGLLFASTSGQRLRGATRHQGDWNARRLGDLYEIGMVFRLLMDRFLAGTLDPVAAAWLSVVNRWLELPEQVFHRSRSYEYLWRRIVDEFRLRPLPPDRQPEQALLAELGRTREAVEQLDATEEVRAARGALAEAEAAVRRGDVAGGRDRLRLAGSWLRSFSLEFSSSVIAKMLEP